MLSHHEQDIKKEENEEFGSISMKILTLYTKMLKDQNPENLEQIKSLIIKLKTTIDINSYSVKYHFICIICIDTVNTYFIFQN